MRGMHIMYSDFADMGILVQTWLSINTRSVKNKSDLIIETSKLENLDFLVISETWLKEEDAHWVATSSLATDEYRIQTISSMRTKRMKLVDAADNDILKQMHQDVLYAVTLHNEVDGVGCQSKTVMQIILEYEAEQKK